MATTQKFCLKWNDFSQNTSSSLQEMRNDTDFSDVTLACEDGLLVHAHKVILAASSTFFSTILKRSKHPQPFIYMRGLSAKELNSVADFIYHGETNILQEDLSNFLGIAEELGLKGISGASDSIHERGYTKPVALKTPKSTKEKNQEVKYVQSKANYSETQPILDNTTIPISTKSSENLNPTVIENTQTPHLNMNLDDLVSQTVKNEADEYYFEQTHIFKLPKSDDPKILDEQILTMLEKREGIWTCKLCGKTVTNNDKHRIMTHIESAHMEGGAHPCNMCGKTYRSVTYSMSKSICFNQNN